MKFVKIIKKRSVKVVAILVVGSAMFWFLNYVVDKYEEYFPTYSINNPKETKWGELTFTDQTHNGDTLPLCTELTAEGQGQFAADTEYLIRFDYPDGLKAELENGRSNYEVVVEYTFQVEAGSYGYLRVTVYSNETCKMYRGESSFGADDALCLKHDVGDVATLGKTTITRPIKFDSPDHLEFVLYTSATPDDGPKVSAGEWETRPSWRIAGIEGGF